MQQMEVSQLPRNTQQNSLLPSLCFSILQLILPTFAASLVFIWKGRREEKGLGSTVLAPETERSCTSSSLHITSQRHECFLESQIYDLAMRVQDHEEKAIRQN